MLNILRFRFGFLAALWIGCGIPRIWCAQEAPPFNEVMELLRSRQHTYSVDELNRLAVDGLLQRLGGLARFADGEDSTNSTAGAGASVLPRLHEGTFVYLRLGAIGPATRGELERVVRDQSSNRVVKGWVLDLRFVTGRDFASAAQVADFFLPGGKPVMDWGQGMFVSTEKAGGFPSLSPLTVLVNRQTRGAAESIAATLRTAGSALAIGTPTAGEVARYEEFPLSNGRRLRLAVAPVRGGDGTFLAPKGVQPDIAVNVRDEEEKLYMEEPFGPAFASTAGASGSTNAPAKPRRRLTEADLVRSRREGKTGVTGTNAAAPSASTAPTPSPRIVRDPSLARALDLLKGLSVIHAQ